MDFKKGCLAELRALSQNVSEEHIDSEDIKQELNSTIDDIYKKDLFPVLLERNDELNSYINILRTKKGNEYNTRTTLSLYVYTKYILPVIGRNVKRILLHKIYVSIFQRYGNEIRFFGTLDMRKWNERLENIESVRNFDYFYSISI